MTLVMPKECLVHVFYICRYLYFPLAAAAADDDDSQHYCGSYYIASTILGALQILMYFICEQSCEEDTSISLLYRRGNRHREIKTMPSKTASKQESNNYFLNLVRIND